MAETKQYIEQTLEHGAVMISDEVIAAIVLNSLKEVEGVVGIGGRIGFDLNSIKNWIKSLSITISETNDVKIDCSIIVAYDHPVIEVAKAAQDAICSCVESMTGIKPSFVNVNVSGIARQ